METKSTSKKEKRKKEGTKSEQAEKRQTHQEEIKESLQKKYEKEFDATKGYPGEGPLTDPVTGEEVEEIKGPGSYDADTAEKWPDMMKFVKDLCPEGGMSGLFTLSVALNQGKEGNWIMTGADEAGQESTRPRRGVDGPDLEYEPNKGQRITVYHGCYPSRVIPLLNKGPKGKMNQKDMDRQRSKNGGRPYLKPKEVFYVSRDKDTAAGYPGVGWDGDTRAARAWMMDAWGRARGPARAHERCWCVR